MLDSKTCVSPAILVRMPKKSRVRAVDRQERVQHIARPGREGPPTPASSAKSVRTTVDVLAVIVTVGSKDTSCNWAGISRRSDSCRGRAAQVQCSRCNGINELGFISKQWLIELIIGCPYSNLDHCTV